MRMNIQEAYRTPNRLDLLLHNSQNTKCTKQRILKAVREKGQVTYKGRPIIITRDFLPDYESQKNLDRCYTDPKRTQMPAQATVPNKKLP